MAVIFLILFLISTLGFFIGLFVFIINFTINSKRRDRGMQEKFLFGAKDTEEEFNLVVYFFSCFYIAPIISYISKRIDKALDEEKEYQEYINDVIKNDTTEE